jgi:HEPN domain-containing protein
MSGPGPDIVGDWLQRARSDLSLGRVALQTKGVFPEEACFHAQQCAEKALKAFLLKLRVDFPRTHAIEVLLDLLKEQGMEIPAEVDRAFELSQYAVQTRYPGEWEPVTKNEAIEALERAALVLAWVEGKVG